MPEFVTPPELSGVGELTASNGLEIISSGSWQFSQQGYNDGATFGVSIGWPSAAYLGTSTYGAPPPPREPLTAGELRLRAQGWQIPGGNALTAWTDPVTHITYPADACQILITGAWVVIREVNSNSYNSFGVERSGRTATDLGSRDMDPWLLNYTSPQATYVIQGSAVEGGAQDTFTGHEFRCTITETARTDNSNYAFQSNTVCRPAWVYVYQRRWQISPLISALPTLAPTMEPEIDLAVRISQYRQTKF